MTFHFGWISKLTNILMEMHGHFISGSADIYFVIWNEISFCQNDCFKCTCVLNVISNMTELIHFALGKLFAWKFHAGLKFHFAQNDQYDIHTGLSFILPHFIWTKVKSWLNTEVRFSTIIKSHTSLSSFRLSCECILQEKTKRF